MPGRAGTRPTSGQGPSSTPQGPAGATHPTEDPARTAAAAPLGLQGIFTPSRELVAHELLRRRTGPGPGGSPDDAAPDDAGAARALAALVEDLGAAGLTGGEPLFLDVPRSCLLGEVPLPLAPGDVVLQVGASLDLDHRAVAGLRAARERGHGVAVADFAGETWRVPALVHADHVKIDVPSAGERLPALVDLARRVNPAVVVVATGTRTRQQLERCRALGVELHQGGRWHRPDLPLSRAEHPPTRPDIASYLTCVQLVATLHDLETPLADVLDLLASDPGLSLRIFATVSSAAYAPRAGISSLQQAVVLLGRRELSGWVTSALLAGTGAAPVPEDTVTWMFARAEACRALAPQSPDAAFTVGLLSAAGRVLDLDVAALTRGCVLKPDVRDALLHGEGPLGAAVAAVERHEEALWGTGQHAGAARPAPRGPGPDLVAARYVRAQAAARARVRALSHRGGTTR